MIIMSWWLRIVGLLFSVCSTQRKYTLSLTASPSQLYTHLRQANTRWALSPLTSFYYYHYFHYWCVLWTQKNKNAIVDYKHEWMLNKNKTYTINRIYSKHRYQQHLQSILQVHQLWYYFTSYDISIMRKSSYI